MKKIGILVFVLAVALVVTGCGEEKAAETAAEKAIESSTGGDADVDIDDDTVSVETDEGSMEVGDEVSLPDEFPSDVYIPSNGKLTSSFYNASVEGYTIGMESDDSLADLKAKYQEELADDGWTIDSMFDVGEGATLSATKGEEGNERFVTVSISSDDDTTTIMIATGSNAVNE